MVRKRTSMLVFAVTLALACAPMAGQKMAKSAKHAGGEAVLWTDPGDIRSRNLFFGPGGKKNVRKEPLFSITERRAMVTDALGADPRVEVDAFQGLLVDYVKRRKAEVVIRGLRAIADFEYEFQLAHMNRHLAPEVETVFLMTSEESFYVSSSLVKEVALMGGDISRMVPAAVLSALQGKRR